MSPMVLFWFWAISVTVQITIAVALYHMAEQRFSNGAPWAWMGLLFGPLALLVFGAYVLFEASMEKARETAERGRVQRFMREYLADRADSNAPTPGGGGDAQVDQLLAAGQYAAAREYATERLRLAHEMGDQTREDIYRGYLRRIDDQAAADAG